MANFPEGSPAHSLAIQEATPQVEIAGPEIFLPAVAIGGFETAILDSARDGRERSQLITETTSARHRRDTDRFRYSKVYRGNATHLGLRASIHRSHVDLSGKPALVAYHTHPKSGIDQFSEGDIADIISHPNLAKIHLVGTTEGITGVVPIAGREQQVQIGQRDADFDHTVHYLQEHGYIAAASQAAETGNYDAVQRILGGLGLEYYVAHQPILHGSLSQGLRLKQPTGI